MTMPRASGFAAPKSLHVSWHHDAVLSLSEDNALSHTWLKYRAWIEIQINVCLSILVSLVRNIIKYYGKESRMCLPFLSLISLLSNLPFVNRRHKGPHSFPLILTYWNS